MTVLWFDSRHDPAERPQTGPGAPPAYNGRISASSCLFEAAVLIVAVVILAALGLMLGLWAKAYEIWEAVPK